MRHRGSVLCSSATFYLSLSGFWVLRARGFGCMRPSIGCPSCDHGSTRRGGRWPAPAGFESAAERAEPCLGLQRPGRSRDRAPMEVTHDGLAFKLKFNLTSFNFFFQDCPDLHASLLCVVTDEHTGTLPRYEPLRASRQIAMTSPPSEGPRRSLYRASVNADLVDVCNGQATLRSWMWIVLNRAKGRNSRASEDVLKYRYCSAVFERVAPTLRNGEGDMRRPP